MNVLLRIIISAVVAFALSYILSGVHIQSFVTALILAVVLGLLNIFVKPTFDHSHITDYDIYFWPVPVCDQCADYSAGRKIRQWFQGGWILVGTTFQSPAFYPDFIFL